MPAAKPIFINQDEWDLLAAIADGEGDKLLSQRFEIGGRGIAMRCHRLYRKLGLSETTHPGYRLRILAARMFDRGEVAICRTVPDVGPYTVVGQSGEHSTSIRSGEA